MNVENKKPGGLAGVVAGQTGIATVGAQGKGLSYRGYSIQDLTEYGSFEEVAFLLLQGRLPNQHDYDNFVSRLINQRELPDELKQTLQAIPETAHPMDVLRTGCSMLGVLEPETGFEQQTDKAERLLACLPSMLVYWYRYSRERVEIDFESAQSTIAGYFLEKLSGQQPSRSHVRAMDVSMILYAEHEFNASTFTARVCTATLSDIYSAITAAIGTLRGTLHGGANEAAMELIEKFQTPDEAEAGVMELLNDKSLIMGFGHRVYTVSDPRNEIIKVWAERLSDECGNTVLFPVAERIEEVMWREKKLFPNLDFYSALVYHFLGIATPLFTPIFVLARVSGWSAHVFEQRGNNRLIRPGAEYIGPSETTYILMSERE